MNENIMDAICEECNHEAEELFELNIDGVIQNVCAECAEANGYRRCSDCGEWELEEDGFVTDIGDFICQTCYENEYFTCEECGEVHHMDDAVRVDAGTRWEQYVCSDCADRRYYRCVACGDYFSLNVADITDGDECVCPRCNRRDEYHRCADCGSIFHEDNGYWSESEQEWYCDSCADDHRHSGNFHEYGYKPDPEFQRRMGEDARTTLTFGVELEVDDGEDKNDLCSDLADLSLPIYMKHDGSLHEEGVEIVTHPCSLAYHQYQLRWAEISRICRRHGYKSHETETCGLHIHVGRFQMGDTWEERNRTAANLVILTNVLWDKLVVFTRRKGGELDRWAERNPLPSVEVMRNWHDSLLEAEALDTSRAGRYLACNLKNEDTVEFRIFKGTLKRDTIIASIQLVNSMTRYAMAHTPTECLNAEWSDVLNADEFKELRAYCEARGIPA